MTHTGTASATLCSRSLQTVSKPRCGHTIVYIGMAGKSS